MVKVKIDMTGWVMEEHGVPDSRLTVVEQGEDYTDKDGHHYARWWCICSCEEHKKILARGEALRNGGTLSCGCLQKEKASSQGIKNKRYNKYDLSGEYGVGWTSNTNKEFYFDLEDYDKIKDYCWYERKKSGSYYALSARALGTRKIVVMHKILGFIRPDHISRNPLDNRKENLREANSQENARNHKLASNNKSGFIGVCWLKQCNKWRAYIKINHNTKSLGEFINIEQAIKARLNAELKYFGVNFAPQRHLFEQYGITTKDDCEVEI